MSPRLRVSPSPSLPLSLSPPLLVCPRRGTTLVVTALVLTALVGLLGLVIDGGQIMFAFRQAQNAADAAAAAAAMDMLAGYSNSTATSTATTFVQQYNGLASATVTVNIPPSSGAYSGNTQYAEVYVSYPVTMNFIQVVGIGTSQTVTARAVAGWEAQPATPGVIVLDPAARPGINLVGNGNLNVNGTVDINSNGGGLDQNGNPINNGNTGNAITTVGNGRLTALDVQSVGGVNSPSSVTNFNSGGSSPLHTGTVANPDPFQNMPAPTTANGAVATNFGGVNIKGTQTLSPGVYSSITLGANANVTFSPGIYVITGGGMSLSGNASASGNGVMIYNAGSNYNVNTGLPNLTGTASNTSPSGTGGATFGPISLTGNGSINFTPLSNASSPFDGMFIYQSRLNTLPITLKGNGTSNVVSGTVYAKWAAVDLTGNGNLNTQFAAQSLKFVGNGNLTLNQSTGNAADSTFVYLVE